MSHYASREELIEMTGCRTIAAQMEWLITRNITIVTNTQGQLLMSREDVAQHSLRADARKADPFHQLLRIGASDGKITIDRRTSGIYFLRKENDIVYIGKTTNLLSRMAGHAGNRKYDFDTIDFFPVPKAKLSLYEGELIARICPKYNVMHNDFDDPLDEMEH